VVIFHGAQSLAAACVPKDTLEGKYLIYVPEHIQGDPLVAVQPQWFEATKDSRWLSLTSATCPPQSEYPRITELPKELRPCKPFKGTSTGPPSFGLGWGGVCKEEVPNNGRHIPEGVHVIKVIIYRLGEVWGGGCEGVITQFDAEALQGRGCQPSQPTAPPSAFYSQ
jgi:hypothetical protein